MYEIGIIGAGPAGYTAAIRASQYGFKVVLFEKQDIGGTCLNRGCIPTKSLLHSTEVYSTVKSAAKYGVITENISLDYTKILDRKNEVTQKIRKSLTQLISSYGIEVVPYEAKIITNNKIEANRAVYECKNIIIATGSVPNKLKFEGTYSDEFVMDSDDILNSETLPENIVIVGSGAIGIEWTRILSELGKKVTLIEMAEHLVPIADIDVSQRIERILKRNRVKFYTNTTISYINKNEITLSNQEIITADKILVATGRQPKLVESNTRLDIKIFISTNADFKTNIDNIYTIGDVNGMSMLAHSAMHQAIEVIDNIKKGSMCEFDNLKVPSVIYGSPEIAWVGKTEQELQKNTQSYKKSIFPIAALGKAYADDKIEGFIKILANENELLGAHIISNEASALIQQLAIAIDNKISPKDLSKTIFAHPTYSEGIIEAIFGLNNLAIHLPPQQ